MEIVIDWQFSQPHFSIDSKSLLISWWGKVMPYSAWWKKHPEDKKQEKVSYVPPVHEHVCSKVANLLKQK